VSKLRDFVRGELDRSQSPDPYTIARAAVKKITDTELRDEAIEEGLVYAIRSQLSSERKTTPAHVVAMAGKSKWARTKDALGKDYFDIMRRREFVGTEWKFLGDCTVADIEAIVVDRSRRATELQHKAACYNRLHDVMVRRGVSTVRELAADEVSEALAA
jgi:hypothetical protein